jgi:hypothetical protein
VILLAFIAWWKGGLCSSTTGQRRWLGSSSLGHLGPRSPGRGCRCAWQA